MIFGDRAARAAQRQREEATGKFLDDFLSGKHSGKFLSFGGGRSFTRPENAGLDDRAIKAMELENDRKSYGGGRGAISGRARRAVLNGLARKEVQDKKAAARDRTSRGADRSRQSRDKK